MIKLLESAINPSSERNATNLRLVEKEKRYSAAFINLRQKVVLLICFGLTLVFSCFQCETESEYRLYVKNATIDTIIMAVTAETEYGRYYHYYALFPNEPYHLESRGGRTPKSYSIEEIIREYERLGRAIEVYRLACTTCEGTKITTNYSPQEYYIEKNSLVSWSPPLISLSPITNSFYNLNSWKIKNTGKKNKWEHATFTITEDDLK